jgi:segregation and condensation protein B
MSNVEVERSIEAILMVVDEPVTEVILAQVLEMEDSTESGENV